MTSEMKTSVFQGEAMETQAKKAGKRTDWFVDARFGMFIHWGTYALAARGEWMRDSEKIPQEEYLRYFRHFNPDILLDNRFDLPGVADFVTPEQHQPAQLPVDDQGERKKKVDRASCSGRKSEHPEQDAPATTTSGDDKSR